MGPRLDAGRRRLASLVAPADGPTPDRAGPRRWSDGGPTVLDLYVRDAPSPQTAIDVFAGEWASRFPDEVGVRAGEASLFDDVRVAWWLDRAGDIAGWHVVELGPLEGGHTAQLEAAGASVTAIESNRHAFLKCLITKELVGLGRSRFLLGDFLPWLEERGLGRPGAACDPEPVDLVVASGVLYHAPDPLRLLAALAGVTDRLAIWTHYYDPEIGARPEQRRLFDPEVETGRLGGVDVTLHRRSYLEALEHDGFCGGPEEAARWMERNDLLAVLDVLGYDRIVIGADDRSHPQGANLLLYADRAVGRPQDRTEVDHGPMTRESERGKGAGTDDR